MVAPSNHSHVPQLDPGRFAKSGAPNIEVLTRLQGRSVLGHRDLDGAEIRQLCRLAAHLEANEIASSHPLDGLLVATAFFEASTRTRLSFESAVLRLDGKVLSVPDGRVTGVAKGESLRDIGHMFNAYADLVVMRHPETSAVHELQEGLERPLINAGNGSGEHPTQALVDWYALLKWRPTLARPNVPDDEKLRLGVIGTPGSMRAVKSFLFAALHFQPAIRSLTVVSAMADPLGADLAEALESSSVPVEVAHDPEAVIGELDVIYINSIAFLGDSYRELSANFRLDAQRDLANGSVILHPLARKAELDESLDATSHNLYFAQAAGAVYVRQALLICLLGRLGSLPPAIFNPILAEES